MKIPKGGRMLARSDGPDATRRKLWITRKRKYFSFTARWIMVKRAKTRTLYEERYTL